MKTKKTKRHEDIIINITKPQAQALVMIIKNLQSEFRIVAKRIDNLEIKIDNLVRVFS